MIDLICCKALLCERQVSLVKSVVEPPRFSAARLDRIIHLVSVDTRFRDNHVSIRRKRQLPGVVRHIVIAESIKTHPRACLRSLM